MQGIERKTKTNKKKNILYGKENKRKCLVYAFSCINTCKIFKRNTFPTCSNMQTNEMKLNKYIYRHIYTYLCTH